MKPIGPARHAVLSMRYEAEIRRRCDRGQEYFWIDSRWLKTLGRGRVQELLAEYGYGPLQDAAKRNVFMVA